ncbi:hypothetical protein QNN95_07365 [Exiguobacterium acetylicum]|uniref:hypothetical protein n=1 Tax=Exiguobacterium acetylicum TaxID=41170 RepID=UPI0035A6A030
MKKIKKWWMRVTNASVWWFVFPVYIIIIFPTLWYTRPILNLNTTDIEIYRLSTTVLAITAAVGTLVSSARSAKSSSASVLIASESIKITKNKDLREQTSHLIPLSKIDAWPLNAPFYNKLFNYRIDELIDLGRIDPNEEKEEYLEKTHEHIFEKASFTPIVNLINIGKGSCVNLEYSFEFQNLEEFQNYSVKTDYTYLEEGTFEEFEPFPYAINIDENYDLMFKDLYIERYVNEKYPEWKEKGNKTNFNYKLKRVYTTEYINIMKPDDEISIKIPNEFIILCRHYLNMSYYFKKISNNESVLGAKKEYFEQWKKENHIKPIGLLKIVFFEESLIKLGEMNPDKRTEYTYKVSIKNIEIKTGYRDIRYYLEVNLSES